MQYARATSSKFKSSVVKCGWINTYPETMLSLYLYLQGPVDMEVETPGRLGNSQRVTPPIMSTLSN